MQFFENIFVRIVLTDHVNNCFLTISNIVMCTLQDFFSGKVRFIYRSTVTRKHSCYGKNYAYASRTSCYC